MENQIVLSMANVLTILGGFGLLFGWFYKLLSKKFDGIDRRFNESDKRIDKKFDAVDKKFEGVDKKFDKIDGDIKDLKSQLNIFEKNTEHRLTVLEMEAKSTNQRLTDFQGQVNQRLSTIEGYLVPKKVFHFEEPDSEDEPLKEN